MKYFVWARPLLVAMATAAALGAMVAVVDIIINGG